MIEQRESHKSNRGLGQFLKILANSGSYGLFVEVTPEATKVPTSIKVFSGDKSFEQEVSSIERHGQCISPY